MRPLALGLLLVAGVSALPHALPRVLPRAGPRVTLHLELFAPRLRLLHAGISVRDRRRCIRFDFRPFHTGDTYRTTQMERRALAHLLPESAVADAFRGYRASVGIADYRDVDWGVTDRTFAQILDYEATHLSQKRYVLGVYDCRHYVSEFASWAVARPLEVWRLHTLWDA